MAIEASVKLIVIGDAAVGKTSMLISYTVEEFPEDYVPTVFGKFNACLSGDINIININFAPRTPMRIHVDR